MSHQATEDKTAVEAAYQASLSWLKSIDKGHYHESWTKASSLMKKAASEETWKTILEETRKPLGEVTSREISDKRTSKNPPGMPAGNYMVMVFKTSFKKKHSVIELITLFFEHNEWHVVTYQFS